MTKVCNYRTIYPKRNRNPRPSDWGVGMTVCVAAIAGAYSGECAVVMAMDQMLSVGLVSGDMSGLSKGMRVHRWWFAMFAGNDLHYVPPIMRDVTRSLSHTATPSVKTVTDAFLKAYQNQRLRIAEQTVLAPLNIDLASYTSMVSENDNEILRSLTDKLNAVSFSVEFLVGGFDATQSARIFSIAPPGTEGHYDDIGFWSIGTGAESAINNFFLRDYKQETPVPEAAYYVAESKFVAEASADVGEHTVMVGLRQDGQMMFITRKKAEAVKKIWFDEGRAPVPANLEERVRPLVRFYPPIVDVHEPDDEAAASEEEIE